MWIRIRAIIIEDEPVASQYLAELLDETCQIEVVGLATESEAGLRLCAELRPEIAFQLKSYVQEHIVDYLNQFKKGSLIGAVGN
jgi:DNA-binding NarL/FixJ family response regulator